MKRRSLLQSAALGAAALAIPRIGRAQNAKVLRFVPYVDLAILDPMINTASQTRTFGYMVFDTLYSQDANFRAQPEMVDGHQTDDDFKLWTLTLREGLRFHDNTPVLARDVVASIKRWGAADPAGRALLGVVADMTAPSDRVVKIRMKQPYRLLPDVLGKIAPSMACIMPERIAAASPSKPITEVIGSGPFRFIANERVSGSRAVFERFAGYAPRPGGGTPGLTGGPKIVNLDRVEWITMPEAATASAALQNGEVDWWEVPSPDLLPMLRRDKTLVTDVKDKTGVVPILRFNCLQPPFDNPAIREAALVASSQREFMEAFSSDPTEWRDKVGLFTPGTPMATKAGMDRFHDKPDLEAAKRAVQAAGYKGERVVVMQPTDHPVNNVMSQVGADLFKRIGLNVDLQAMDAGTMFQRRANREGVDKGGWSCFPSMVGGADVLNPAVSFLTRGNGADAWYGWPTIPKLETARAAWFDAPDLPTQQALCGEMQMAVLDGAPHIPLGQILQPTSYRATLTGVLEGIPKFWNVQKT
ncbi:ABC transporter substrate-binding protein [Acidisphaera sp. L21]|uniref:ABC transporter substrate-binding protein n=1 Tax=Acidisphaera sp. L21 TaxID=1641851 RepID=UPI00131C68C3|nr:ABC transporter substrate-binding protein [Acidisphaera sp. L21]